MAFKYPIEFKLPAAPKSRTFAEDKPVGAPFGRIARQVKPRAGQETQRFVLASIGSWPEVKTVMEPSCVDLPWPIGHVCTDLPRVYQRTCTKIIYVDVTYPTGGLQDVTDCVTGSAVAAAIAAVLADPATGAAVFEAALKACLEAKGKEWAQQVSVSAGLDSQCGDWHPI